MHRTGCLRWALPIAICTLLGSPSARADEEGYQLNRLDPAPAGDPFVLVESPQFSSENWLATRLIYDYAKKSLAVNGRDENGALIPSLIEHSHYARFGVSGTFMGRLGVSLELPFLLGESGTELNGVGPSAAAISDPRIGVRGLLFGTPSGPLAVSASLDAWIPVGGEDNLTGDNGLRLLPKLTLGGLAHDERVRWAFNAGYLHRQAAFLSSQASPIGNTVGSEIRLAAGASYVAANGKVSFGPEATIAFAIDSAIPDEQDSAFVELFATSRFAITDEMGLGLGVGGAILGSGSDSRALLTFSYSPGSSKATSSLASDEATETPLEDAGPVDQDADGIADSEDVCPQRAGTASTNALRNGCPAYQEKVVVLPDENGNVGAVEIDDGTSITLVDKAYASSEVGSNGKAKAVAPSTATAKAVDNAVAVMAAALPPADGDEDGIRDRDDACPDRKGEVSSDPLRNGCPPAAERVIVLPDADGHIGGIEIDDGTTKILVDKAYASVEVSKEGKVQAQPPSKSPKVIENAIATMGAVLPPADSDGDGIEDGDDSCPARKGVVSATKQRNGCPEATEVVVILPDENGHVGSLEIDDGVTKTVLDKAFATSEVGSDGRAAVVQAAPPAAVLRSLESITTTMPRADTDGDGIVDAYDACRLRPGNSNADSLRHGCPVASETIVLIEDEDGHVGAIEIGEGDAMVVLDKALATAEIGSDGGVVKAEASKQEVDVAFAEVFATAKAAKKQLPKSAGRVHFTVYFDEKAVPTRDVDEQIGALIEELEKLDAYSIEVVGHTDATGSNRANLRVGLSRAVEIAKRLTTVGVPTAQVSASTRGSSEPAVAVLNPTTVPEPLNRRVEIRIKDPGLPQLVVPFEKRTKTTRKMKGEYRALAKRLKGLEGYTVLVVGHVDATETKGGLGLKRANDVARRLVRAGLSKRIIIEVVSKDATDPAVAGEAGKAELMNRRVEIFVNN